VRIGSFAAGERECFLRDRGVDAVHLVDDLARLDLGDEILRVALAVAHATSRAFATPACPGTRGSRSGRRA
jgi:hypothetical protein